VFELAQVLRLNQLAYRGEGNPAVAFFQDANGLVFRQLLMKQVQFFFKLPPHPQRNAFASWAGAGLNDWRLHPHFLSPQPFA
jgi:hypothetical protein